MGKITETRIWYESGKLRGAIGRTFVEKEESTKETTEGNVGTSNVYRIECLPFSPDKIRHAVDITVETINVELEKEQNNLSSISKKLRLVEKITPVAITIATIIGFVSGMILTIWGTLTLYGPTTTIGATLIATVSYIMAGLTLGAIFGAITYSLFKQKNNKYSKAKRNAKTIISRLEKSKKLITNLP